MAQFWLVGGQYDPQTPHAGVRAEEQWLGPFEEYEVVEREWARRAGATVRDHRTRYRIEGLEPGFRIERIDPDEPPCTD